MLKRIFTTTLLLCIAIMAFAQVDPDPRVLAELEKRGLDPQEVTRRLEERGVNVEEIDETNFTQFQAEIEAVVAEMEAEKANAEKPALEQNIQIVVPETATDTNSDSPETLPTEEIAREPEVNAGFQEFDTEDLPEPTNYGQEIFRNKDFLLTLQSKNAKPPMSYVIGVGDELNVAIFGRSVENFNLKVAEDGYVRPGKYGRVYVKGFTLKQTQELLRKFLSQFYLFNKGQFAVSINYVRNIRVNVVGSVFNSGTYTIPATNTAFNALVAAGGPNDIGSVRGIKIIRDGGNQTLDVYKFLNDPSIAEDFYLQDNDYIFVPSYDKLVGISGAVKRPFQYELVGNEGLVELVKFAEGTKANAFLGNVKVTRFENDETQIIDVDLKSLMDRGQNFVLKNGDKVSILSIGKNTNNFVEVQGAVTYPGKFQLNAQSTISDVMQKAGLRDDARKDIAFIFSKNADGTYKYRSIDFAAAIKNDQLVTLAPEDRIVIMSLRQYTELQQVSIQGAVKNPSEYPYDMDGIMKVSDIVLLANGLSNGARAEAIVKRRDINNKLKYNQLTIDILDAVENTDGPNNLTLLPGDRIVVFKNETFTSASTVKVVGAVRYPKEITYAENMQLKDVLLEAGGLSFGAARNQVEVNRVILIDNNPSEILIAKVEIDENLNIISGDAELTLQPFDQIIVRRIPNFSLQRNITIKGEVKYPGIRTIADENERISSLIQRAGGLTEEAFPEGAILYRAKEDVGYIILDLSEVMKNPKSKYNYILKEGDVVSIPKRKDFVSIVGATELKDLYNDEVAQDGKVSTPFVSGKRAKYYINEYAAGVSDNGSSKRITVRYPNGELKRAKDFGLFAISPKVVPGSEINVGIKPIDPEKEEGKKEDIDWGKVFADSVAQATAILTLILLVRSLD